MKLQLKLWRDLRQQALTTLEQVVLQHSSSLSRFAGSVSAVLIHDLTGSADNHPAESVGLLNTMQKWTRGVQEPGKPKLVSNQTR